MCFACVACILTENSRVFLWEGNSLRVDVRWWKPANESSMTPVLQRYFEAWPVCTWSVPWNLSLVFDMIFRNGVPFNNVLSEPCGNHPPKPKICCYPRPKLPGSDLRRLAAETSCCNQCCFSPGSHSSAVSTRGLAEGKTCWFEARTLTWIGIFHWRIIRICSRTRRKRTIFCFSTCSKPVDIMPINCKCLAKQTYDRPWALDLSSPGRWSKNCWVWLKLGSTVWKFGNLKIWGFCW